MMMITIKIDKKNVTYIEFGFSSVSGENKVVGQKEQKIIWIQTRWIRVPVDGV